jgi:hypothetical protein
MTFMLEFHSIFSQPKSVIWENEQGYEQLRERVKSFIGTNVTFAFKYLYDFEPATTITSKEMYEKWQKLKFHSRLLQVVPIKNEIIPLNKEDSDEEDNNEDEKSSFLHQRR